VTPLNNSRIAAAGDLLYRHWIGQTRLVGLPLDLCPATRADGYAIQAELERRTKAPLFGWKIAATSGAGQAHINVDGPLAGRLLAERIVADGGLVRLGNNAMRVAEIEFAFRFAVDLPARGEPYAVDEVCRAVQSLHPAIEIPDSRYDDFTAVGAPQLIADNACADLFVLGPARDFDWRQYDLSTAAPVASKPGRFERKGLGANVLGDPRVALTWLVNELSALGRGAKAGEVVTTGTCLTPIDIAPGDEIIGDFGPIGRVSVRIAA
jgi:2-keto-4-pentenoate hydratase